MQLAPCCFAGCFQLLELAGFRWLLVAVGKMFSAPFSFEDAVGFLLFCRMFSAPCSF